MLVVYFFIWLFFLYIIHRIVHVCPYLKEIHWDHHQYISNFTGNNWHWTNLLLINDNWKSTLDLWITEVIPTIIFCFAIGNWYIFWFYYFWAAVIQEIIEHNPQIDFYPFLTSGKWHLIHHENPHKNFGLFLPIIDIILGTNVKKNF